MQELTRKRGEPACFGMSWVRNGGSVRGTAMLEFAAILPFLVLMLISIIEVGNAVNEYLIVNRIAYEAVRFGASLPSMDPAGGLAVTGSGFPGHSEIQSRVIQLLKDYKFGSETTPPRMNLLTTQLCQPGPVESHKGFSVLRLNLAVPVKPVLFPPMQMVQLKVQAAAPYLVRGNITQVTNTVCSE